MQQIEVAFFTLISLCHICMSSLLFKIPLLHELKQQEKSQKVAMEPEDP
jgi:hypothetical protein